MSDKDSSIHDKVAIQNLIMDAQAEPAEFAADLLIRMAESSLVTNRKKRIELLEEAFRRALDAQQKFRREYIGGNVDTQPGYRSYAFDLGLDSLSLRSRAIRAMISLDN